MQNPLKVCSQIMCTSIKGNRHDEGFIFFWSNNPPAESFSVCVCNGTWKVLAILIYPAEQSEFPRPG